MKVIAALLSFALLAQTARAEAAPSQLPSETLTGEAKTEYESGKLLYRDGDFGGALVKFSSAYKRSRDPRLLWNMAACEKSLRHYAKALRYVRLYASDPSGLVSEEDRSEAAALVKVMDPFTMKLRVVVNEPGAEIVVDEEVVGTSPLESALVVDITARRIRARKAGFQEANKDVPSGMNETTVELALTRIVHEGRLVVRAKTTAAIAIDGLVVGSASWSGTLASGGHTLRVTAPDMRPYESEILVVDDQTREIAVSLEPEATRLPAWVWVAGGAVALSGLGVGGYFLFRQEASYEGPRGTLDPGIVQASRPIRF